jgi:uncharacterized protein (TIGR01244 family)
MEDTIQVNDHFAIAKFAPEPEQLKQASEEGFRTVVNMQTDDEDKKLKMSPQEEGRVVEETGMNYLHYPVDGEKLSAEVVDNFRSKATKLSSPVLVHCASGKRSGAMIMMHIGCTNGMDGDEVIKKAEEMGFECDTPELENFVKDYVNRHNGKS